jgi:Flp pilus assembly protein TadD
MQEFNWTDAEREAKLAVDLDPNYPTGMQWYASILLDLGRYDEAAQFYQRAYELDPLSGPINDGLINTFQVHNEHEQAVQNALKFIEVDPSFPAVFSDLGLSYLKLGRSTEAITYLEKAVELSGRESWVLGNLGYAYAVSGKRSEALAVLEELKSRYPKTKTGARYLAAIFAGLGEKDNAFAWLDKELENKGGRTLEIRWAIPFESLRDDTRFNDLLKRMRLP